MSVLFACITAVIFSPIGVKIRMFLFVLTAPKPPSRFISTSEYRRLQLLGIWASDAVNM